jgi:hypothetical protein
MKPKGVLAATVAGTGPGIAAPGAVSPPGGLAEGARPSWGFATIEVGTDPSTA